MRVSSAKSNWGQGCRQIKLKVVNKPMGIRHSEKLELEDMGRTR
jgi:hypothetical protein